MWKSKNFLVGLSAGVAVGFFLSWFFLVQRPFLFSDKAKASYSLGQQQGRNLKNQKIDLSFIAFSAALRDAQSSSSRLSDEEISKGKKYLFAQTALGKHLASPQPVLNQDVIDRDGFFTLSPSFQFKLLDQQYKSLNEVRAQASASDSYEFKVSLSSTKPVTHRFQRRQLPPDFEMALSFLKENEKMQIQVSSLNLKELRSLLRLTFNETDLVTIERLKMKQKKSR